MRSPVVNVGVDAHNGGQVAEFAAFGDRRVPLAVLRERGARLATALVAAGIGEDDSVALLMRNDFSCQIEHGPMFKSGFRRHMRKQRTKISR